MRVPDKLMVAAEWSLSWRVLPGAQVIMRLSRRGFEGEGGRRCRVYPRVTPIASGDVKQDDGVSAGQRDPLRLMQTLN